MFQAKYRKILWIVLAVHLLLAHFWGTHRLWMKLLAMLAMGHPNLFRIRISHIWLAGTVITALWQVYSYESFRKKALRGMEPVSESWIKGIHLQAVDEAELSSSLPMYRSSQVGSPMVIGFSKQVLFIPIREYDSAALRMIFLHEYIHVKKKDIWYKLFFTAGICILWFQPLMYLLKWVAFRDVETACDQKVVEGKGEAERSAYGQLLIDSLRNHRQEVSYPACFYNSKTVMKARLAVVMDQREHLGYLGALVCLFLAVETAVLVLTSGIYAAREIHRRQEPETLANIYEGYELPESFTEKAVEEMVKTAEKGRATYEELAKESQEELEMSGAAKTEGPWQIENPYECWRVAPDLLYRYVMYYENQERGSKESPQLPENNMLFSGLDILETEILAGDDQKFVYGIRFRDFIMGEEEAESLRELQGTQAGYDEGSEYFYYDWALHIQRKEENVYELVGIAQLSEVLEAYEAEGVPAEFEQFTKLDLWQRPDCRAQTFNGAAEVTWDNGKTWTEVPIAMEKLTARGDQMDGVLTGIQEKSYVVSEDITAFAYGGSPEVPVTVTCSPDQGVTWNTSVVTHSYPSVRQFFLSFPDSQNGFLFLTCDRVVWQEFSILFRTYDGGKTWEEIGIAGDRKDNTHSLTIGGKFITPEVGFLSIRSSQEPALLRTIDGGRTWEWQELPDIPEEMAEDYAFDRLAGRNGWSADAGIHTLLGAMGYCMAYPPEGDSKCLNLYLTMEEYSELRGTKVKYHSEDLGDTWILDGYVLRK